MNNNTFLNVSCNLFSTIYLCVLVLYKILYKILSKFEQYSFQIYNLISRLIRLIRILFVKCVHNYAFILTVHKPIS